MNNRFPIILQAAVLILLLGLGITGCGSVSDGAGPANGSTEYVIRLGHSDTEDNLITATPLWQISTQNFFLTIAPYFIVTAVGFRNLALGTAGMLLAALVLGFVIGRK